MLDPKNAPAIALAGLAIAVVGLLLINQWSYSSASLRGLIDSAICLDRHACIYYRWILLVAVALWLWAGYLKFGKRAD